MNQQQLISLVKNTTYEIVNVEKLKTQFGNKYVLVSNNGFKYWTNNKINEFITANKGIKKFHLETLEVKTFKSKKGDVTYISVEIS